MGETEIGVSASSTHRPDLAGPGRAAAAKETHLSRGINPPSAVWPGCRRKDMAHKGYRPERA